MNLDFETAPPHPRVSVKVGYLLSDLPAPGMGNMCDGAGQSTARTVADCVRHTHPTACLRVDWR